MRQRKHTSFVGNGFVGTDTSRILRWPKVKNFRLPTRKANDLKIQSGHSNPSLTLVILVFCLAPFAHGQGPAAGFTPALATETVVLPQSVPDPLEPVNRVMWAFNQGLMTGVIKPTSRVYRFVVVKPVRTSIGNFGRNLIYPGRLINNLLQGKWDW